jgi:hypothetical protein
LLCGKRPRRNIAAGCLRQRRVFVELESFVCVTLASCEDENNATSPNDNLTLCLKLWIAKLFPREEALVGDDT